MRILHFGIAGYDNTVFSLLAGFRNLGHEVMTCDIVHKKQIAPVAEAAINGFRPDMVFTIGRWHNDFEACTLWRLLREFHLPHIYWATEDPTFFLRFSARHIKEYDFVFTTSEECIDKYKIRGVPSSYLPFACNPAVHKRVAPIPEYKNDIVVLSNNYGRYDEERYAFRGKCYRDLIEPVIKRGYDIKLYGNGWGESGLMIPKNCLGGYVRRSKVPQVYSSAKIVLIVQWDYTGHICYKTYEALGCGCLQISPYTPLLGKYFKHGEHLLYSRSPEETLAYVHYYLAHDREREAIALKGQQEAYVNHSCSLRAGEAIGALREYGLWPQVPDKTEPVGRI